MKRWNKLPALLLAAAMALGINATALAAEKAPYTDVAGTWSEEYVSRVTELKLIDGKTETTFAPNENMTRADLVTALYRLAGSPAAEGQNPFADVADDAAYAKAVVWASGKGIVNGKSADTFVPDGQVTRQEIAKVLDLYAAQAVGKQELVSRVDDMSGYPDAASVADWAKSYMNWAVSSEFITGSDGKLLPEGTATRAQVAAILCRYLDDASTGDASKDDPRNGDEIGEKELLVVSFGTSYNDNRVATIGAVESAMEQAFEDYSVRRGFTANIIIEHVQRRDGEVIDDVTEALDRAKANGVKELLVQPTHLMNGYEYGDLVKALEKRADDFETIKIGAPLLTTDEDFKAVAEAMVRATEGSVLDDKTAVCWMGHGTEAASNGIYSKMQQVLTDAGYDNYFVGTVEAAPTAENLVKLVKEGGYEKVVLRPMMIVAGDHANNDMAGEEADSWKSIFTAAGFEVQCEVKGLGEIEAVQQLLVAHAKDAKSLSETGIDVEPNPSNPDDSTPAGPSTPAEDAKPAEGGSTEPAALADGTYTIDVTCEQSMFKIDSCVLTVEDGKMTAALTLGSTSFDKMFVGTEAAAKADDSAAVAGVEADGKTTFTLSVEALDKALDYAAHSVKKDTWYARTLTFDSASVQAA